MVDVGTLHQHDLILHYFAGDGVSQSRVAFVAVHTFQFHGLAVHVVITSGQSELVLRCGRVLDFHFTETHDGGNRLDNASFFVFQLAHQGIAVRQFGRPFIRVLHLHHHFRSLLFTGFDHGYRSRGCDSRHRRVLIRIQLVGIQRINHRITFGGFLSKVADIRMDSQLSVGISFIQIGSCHQIAYMQPGYGCQGYGAVDARQTEHILRFQERTVRAAVNFGSHSVGPFHQVAGYIETGGVTRVFRETYVPAIDPEIEE